MLNAHGLDMAGPIGVQLHHRDAHGVDGIRVHLAGDVALDDTDAVVFPQAIDQGDDHTGLTGAGGTHDVGQADLMLGQLRFDGLADVFVPLHDLVHYFDQIGAAAVGTLDLELVDLILRPTLVTAHGDRYPLGHQDRPLGGGAFAEDIEILLYALRHNARIFPDPQMDLPNLLHIVLLCRFHGDVYNTLRDR